MESGNQAHAETLLARAEKVKKIIGEQGESWGLSALEIRQLQDVCDNIFTDELDKARGHPDP